MIFFLLLFLLFPPPVFADVIPPNQHSVDNCIKISNLPDYPHLQFQAKITKVMGQEKEAVKNISANLCLDKGYKFNQFNLQAIDKNTRQLYTCRTKIDPSAFYVEENNPLRYQETIYKIDGFDHSSFELKKTKIISRFNNGQPDKIENLLSDSTLPDPPQPTPTPDTSQLITLIIKFFQKIFSLLTK